VLGDILAGCDYSLDVMRKINVDREGIGLYTISSLPTLDLCGTELVGMQCESMLMSRIMETLGNACFSSL